MADQDNQTKGDTDSNGKGTNPGNDQGGQNPTNPDGTGNPPAPDAVPKEDIDNTPVNPGKETEAAAVKAAKTSADRQYTPSIEKGADADFNTFVRKAHEGGNPEQLSPMQIEQNARDKAKEQDTTGKQHDMSDPDTKWVVDQGIAS